MLSACPTAQQLEVIEREQRRLRAANRNVLTQSAAIRNEFDSVRSTLADTRANLQKIQRELIALKEKVAEVQYRTGRQIGQSTREGDQRIKEMEGQIAKIDETLKAQGILLKAREEELRLLRETLLATVRRQEPRTSGETEPTSEFDKGKTPGESDVVRRNYEEARELLEEKNYRGAIARFKEFLKKYPESDYSDNAQYWIGESHYALREFDQAILEFDAVRRKYPKGDKVPASLLKLAFAFAELGDRLDARLILQELIDRYPQSQEVVKAKQKLKALES